MTQPNDDDRKLAVDTILKEIADGCAKEMPHQCWEVVETVLRKHIQQQSQMKEQHGRMAHYIRSIPIGYEFGQDLLVRCKIAPPDAIRNLIKLPEWLMKAASEHEKGQKA